MTEQEYKRICALLTRTRRLIGKANALTGQHLPPWRRVLNWRKGNRLINRAAELLYEVDAIQGKPRPAQIWLGMGRRGIVRLQWTIGILNAYTMVNGIADERYISATVSAVCLLVTTTWRLPYAPPTKTKG